VQMHVSEDAWSSAKGWSKGYGGNGPKRKKSQYDQANLYDRCISAGHDLSRFFLSPSVLRCAANDSCRAIDAYLASKEERDVLELQFLGRGPKRRGGHGGKGRSVQKSGQR